jgi:phage gp36-like protein
MTFLTPEDFDLLIRADQLNKMIGDNTTLLSQAVDTALDEIVSYVSGRYDMALALEATSEDRNSLLVARAVDMALYHLHSILSPRNIPDLRRDRYLEAVDLFKGVSKGTRFLSLPVKEVEGQTTLHLYGSNTRFNFGA